MVTTKVSGDLLVKMTTLTNALRDKGFKVSHVKGKDITIAALCILKNAGYRAIKALKRLKT